MGLQEALEWAQLQFPDAMAERQLWYMDDGTLVGILADIAFFLDLLTGGVRDARGRAFEECTGYQINIGKSSLWGRCSAEYHVSELEGMSVGEREEADWANERAAAQRAECMRLLPAVAHGLRGVRDPVVHYPPEQMGKMTQNPNKCTH